MTGTWSFSSAAPHSLDKNRHHFFSAKSLGGGGGGGGGGGAGTRVKGKS